MSMTPTFTIKLSVPGFAYSPAAWPTKHCGRPNDKTLAQYVADFEQDCLTGANRHLGAQTVSYASVTRQSTGEVVARYVA